MAGINALPSLGFGGAFTPSSDAGSSFDWGGLVKDALGVTKSYFDSTASVANSQLTKQQIDQRLLTGSPLEQQLTAGQAAQNNGISTPILLAGGGIALVALILVLKN